MKCEIFDDCGILFGVIMPDEQFLTIFLKIICGFGGDSFKCFFKFSTKLLKVMLKFQFWEMLR